MALSIRVNNGVFEMSGRLTSDNTNQVIKYFKIILKMNTRIKISLEKLDTIDMTGILKLKRLSKYAKENGVHISFLSAPHAKINTTLFGSGITLSTFNASKYSA